MPLADDIAEHRDLIVADLVAALDYYEDTKAAWDVVNRHIKRGGKVNVVNQTTGSLTTEKELVRKARSYVAENLAAATFQQFVALFEDFLVGLLRHWLLAYPQRLERKQISVSEVFMATDLNALKLVAVNSALNELSYKRVRDWFTFLGDLVNLGCPTSDEIDRLAEIKATRDVHVHNRGVANAAYEDKAGAEKRVRRGGSWYSPAAFAR